MNEEQIELYKILEEKISNISLLKNNWDGRNSIKINQLVIDYSYNFIKRLINSELLTLKNKIFIIPAGDGSVHIELHTKKYDIEYHIWELKEFNIWIYDIENDYDIDSEGQEDCEDKFIQYIKLIKDSNG